MIFSKRENDSFIGSQVAEWLGNRAINQKAAGSIPGRAKQLRCVLGQGLPVSGGMSLYSL